MEISDDRILEMMNKLVEGQSSTKQSIVDLKESVEKGFTFFQGEHEDLEDRVHGVEKKIWYGAGAASVLGVISGALVGLFHK